MIELAPFIVILALLGFIVWRERQYDKQTQERELAFRLERAGLLTRIQHPEIIVGEAQEQVVPDEVLRDLEADEMDLVGAIVNGEPDGSD